MSIPFLPDKIAKQSRSASELSAIGDDDEEEESVGEEEARFLEHFQCGGIAITVLM